MVDRKKLIGVATYFSQQKQVKHTHNIIITKTKKKSHPSAAASLFILAREPTTATTASGTMRWDELKDQFLHVKEEQEPQHQDQQDTSYLDFDTLSLISKPKDYYRILEVDYEATEEEIRSNFIRLALKWHPDKKKGEDSATSKFQEINEAYQVLSDPIRKEEYDRKGMLYLYDYNIVDYLNRYKGLILTCNGLGMKTSIL